LSELLKWFERRRSLKVLKVMERHLALTISAVEDLERAIKAAAERNSQLVNECLKRVDKSEMEADSLRRSLMVELAKGELSPSIREDLMHLVKRIDMVADWSRETARVLNVIPINDVSKTMWDASMRMMEGVRKCAYSLRICVEKLVQRKLKEALNAADEVERAEEEVDALYEDARRLLVREEFKTVGLAVMFRDFLDAIEMIADWCENSCDQVRVIVVSMM